MANNVAATPGTGVTFKTTDNAGVHTGHVNVDSSALPTGAATAAKQDTAATAIGDVETAVAAVETAVAAVTAKLIAAPATEAKQDTGNTSLGTIAGAIRAEDAASADGHTGIVAMAVRKATPANVSGTDGDYEMLQVSAGRLWTSATIDAAIPAGTNAIGKLAANSGVDIGDVDVTTVGTITPGTAATSLGKAEDAAHTSGDVGVMMLGVRVDSAASLGGTDGDYVPPQFTSTGSMRVADAAVLAAITDGDVAHDAADSGNPAKIGAKAIAGLSGATLVAAADRTNLYAGLDGALIIRPHCGLEDIVSGVASNTDGASTEVIAAAAAGIKQYLTSATIINTSASMVYVELKSGTTVKWRLPVPATSGVVFNPPVPLPPNAAAEAWNFDSSAAATTLYFNAIAFKSKV